MNLNELEQVIEVISTHIEPYKSTALSTQGVCCWPTGSRSGMFSHQVTRSVYIQYTGWRKDDRSGPVTTISGSVKWSKRSVR
ncbi:hypothetical protein J6590_017509 [Homalodisca vitripennis]|nr:hypothetical protein J6590_017509 [Homalodisca vitripennis]